ncbi:MAG: hypothetical protein WC795_00955 [Candidatus Paceibacterota bacterium]
MLNKHFFKFLFGFIGMLTLGIVGLMVINYYDQDQSGSSTATPYDSTN